MAEPTRIEELTEKAVTLVIASVKEGTLDRLIKSIGYEGVTNDQGKIEQELQLTFKQLAAMTGRPYQEVERDVMVRAHDREPGLAKLAELTANGAIHIQGSNSKPFRARVTQAREAILSRIGRS